MQPAMSTSLPATPTIRLSRSSHGRVPGCDSPASKLNSKSASGAIENSAGAVRIGNNTYAGEAFAGVIDDVRIYDYALTETQIQTDMAIAVPAPSTLLGLLSGCGMLVVLQKLRRSARRDGGNWSKN